MTLLSNLMFDFYAIFLLICPWLCFIVFSYYNETLFLLSTSIYWIFFVLESFILKTFQSVFAFFIVFHIFFFLQERNLWWGIFCCLSSFISLSLFPIIRNFFLRSVCLHDSGASGDWLVSRVFPLNRQNSRFPGATAAAVSHGNESKSHFISHVPSEEIWNPW